MRWLCGLVLGVTGCSLTWNNEPQAQPDAAVSSGDAAMSSPDAAVPATDAAIDATPAGSADLRIAIQAPGRVAASGAMSFRLTIDNTGPSAASAVSVTQTLPTGIMFVGVTSPDWSCSAAGTTVTCTRASLGVGTLSFDVRITAPGTAGAFMTTATANATTADPVSTNNSATVSSIVGWSGGFGAQTAYATGVQPEAIVTGDFNGDGNVDVAVANNNNQGSQISNLGSVSVLLGSGNGALQAATHYTAGYGPVGIAAGDFNRDGALDLVTTNLSQGLGGGNVTVLIGNGNGTFRAPVAYAACCSPYGIAVGDLNGDGKLDLAVANYYAVQVLLGNGLGGFAAPVAYAAPGTFSIALTDLNGDNKLDVIVGYGNTTAPDAIAVLLGNGNGTLQTAVAYNTNKGLNTLAVADFDRDGKLDVAAANRATNDISVLRGTGTGALLAPTHVSIGQLPTWVVAGDFNGDAKPDVTVTNADSSTVAVRLGNGDGTFQSVTAYPTNGGSSSLATADFNRDGCPDLVSANSGTHTVSVLLASP